MPQVSAQVGTKLIEIGTGLAQIPLKIEYVGLLISYSGEQLMSKPLAAYYGYKKVNQPQQPKPQEYTVLGINQPLIAPNEDNSHSQSLPQPANLDGGQRSFLVSLLLSRWG